MIYRYMFVGYSDETESICIKPENNCYVALSRNGQQIYLYVESNSDTIIPEQLAEGKLLPYPDGELWKQANEIFHYSRPISPQQWARKEKKVPHVMVNRLKPEKMASYVYYHYQYQEEYPGDGDRYGVMFLFFNQLIFYLERPTEKETEKLPGLFCTGNTPLEHWQDIMKEHFSDHWKDIENLENSEYIAFGEV